MKAHRAARSIAFGTDGKLRVLAELLNQHFPDQTFIFTDDNARVYRISREFLIPAITSNRRQRTSQYFGAFQSRNLSHPCDLARIE